MNRRKPENIIVCNPTSILGYKPPFEANTMQCDYCNEEMWVPASPEDHPSIEGSIEGIDWCCYRCYTNLLVHDKLSPDTQVHFIHFIGDHQENEENRLFLLSKMQLDQELSWVEENLGKVCEVANEHFYGNKDPKYRLLGRTLLIFIWEVLHRRRDGLIDEEQIFDRWTDEESKHIMKFILWNPGDE